MTISYVGPAEAATATATADADATLQLTADMTIRQHHRRPGGPAVGPGSLEVVLVPRHGHPQRVHGAPRGRRRDPGGEAGEEGVRGPAGAHAYPPCGPVGGEVRWVRDGEPLVGRGGGGVTNGNDMVAACCRDSGARFPGPLVEAVLGMADVGDRPQGYDGEGTGGAV